MQLRTVRAERARERMVAAGKAALVGVMMVVMVSHGEGAASTGAAALRAGYAQQTVQGVVRGDAVGPLGALGGAPPKCCVCGYPCISTGGCIWQVPASGCACEQFSMYSC